MNTRTAIITVLILFVIILALMLSWFFAQDADIVAEPNRVVPEVPDAYKTKATLDALLPENTQQSEQEVRDSLIEQADDLLPQKESISSSSVGRQTDISSGLDSLSNNKEELLLILDDLNGQQ